MMPAIMNLIHAVKDSITQDGKLQINDPSGILNAMNRLYETNGVVKKHSDAPIKLTKSTGSIDDAVRSAMRLSSLSIYEVKVNSFILNSNTRKHYKSADIVVASNGGLGALRKIAIELANKEFSTLRANSEVKDDSVLVLSETEVGDIYPLLLNDEIIKIRSAIDSYNGVTTENNFTRVTGLSYDFQGNSSWEVNGDLFDHDEITSLIIKSMCYKSPSEQGELMSYFTVDADEEQRLS